MDGVGESVDDMDEQKRGGESEMEADLQPNIQPVEKKQDGKMITDLQFLS